VHRPLLLLVVWVPLQAGCRVEGSGLDSSQVVPVGSAGPGRLPPIDPVQPIEPGSAGDAGFEVSPDPPWEPPSWEGDGGVLQPPLADAQPTDGMAVAEDAQVPGIEALDRSLVLWLALDDAIGAAAPRDGSGQRNRVRMLALDADLAWVAGRVGGALDLSSAGSGMGHLRVDSSPSINQIGAELTIAVWLARAPRQAGVVVSRRASSAGGSLYRLEVTAGDQLRLVLNDRRGVRLSVQATSPLPPAPWVHVAITSDEAEARLYIDGRPAGRAPYGVPIATDVSPLLVGASEGASPGALTDFFPGRLDELLIYHRALSEIEVSALASGARPSDAGLER
jgi:hypothetical protein